MRSRHLESRRVTGEILRGGPLTTLELRAAMVIGTGSASFNLMRDLAVRVPIVTLPPWMDGGSYPIGIDDVAYALTRALFVPLTQSAWFELPGPEWITHRDLVMILAAFVGTRVAPRRWAWLTPETFRAPFGMGRSGAATRCVGVDRRPSFGLDAEGTTFLGPHRRTPPVFDQTGYFERSVRGNKPASTFDCDRRALDSSGRAPARALPMTGHRETSENRGAPFVVLFGSFAVALAWLMTPRYGPWICHAAFGLAAAAVAWRYGSNLRAVRWSLNAVISGCILGLGLAIISWVVAPIIIRLIPAFNSDLTHLYSTLNRAPGPYKALPILLLAAAVEELVWRGEWVDWLQKRLPVAAAAAIATVSYALPIAASHSLLLFGFAAGLGLILTLQRIVVGTWLAPMLAHLIWALLVLVVRPLK